MRARCVLAACLCAVLATGCAGPPRPGGSDDPATSSAPSAVDPDAASAPTATGGADPAALAVARAFALASRTWTPATLRTHWRRQVTLSTGALRSTLRTTAPAAADIARVRADRASATATILTLAPIRAYAGTMQVVVRLRERVVAAGQAAEQTTANQVDLIRHGHAWRVTAFTLAP
jgi:hypothetical protein